MFWKKKKKQNNYKEIIGLDNTQGVGISGSYNFLLPFCRAFLCFLLTMGSICGFVSCFSAEFNLYAVLGVLLSLSVIIALVRNLKHAFLKNIAYITFLMVFIFLITRYYAYVNSGYHAIVNLIYASLENYLDIPALVYYDELIENSVASITVFLIFVGAFELLLYHMWIGERVWLIDVLFVSFTPYVIPLFIELYPDDLYVLTLMTSYFALIILCFGMHIRNKSRVYTRKNPWSSGIKGFSYGANGLTYLASIAAAFVISLCVLLIVNITVPYSTYVRNQKTSTLKAEITDDVKYFVTFGFSGYFNRYHATGGLNDGRLGGIHSVRPDYETDLTVTFVPTSYKPVYLRGFVGINYTDRQWYNSAGLLEAGLIDTDIYNYYENDTLLVKEFDELAFEYRFHAPSRIDILNVGANINYKYYPYYTDYNLTPPYEINKDGSPLNTSVNAHYFLLNTERTYPFYPEITNIKKPVVSLPYIALSPYLQIPESTRNEIIEFLEDNDLCTRYITEDNDYHELSGAELQTVINQLSNKLSSDFVYSLNPGITPKKCDFAGYFLNESKKGYCAHFATSSTLILRCLGIPARYVEGYVLSYDDLAESVVVEDADVSDYIDTSVTTSDLTVVRTNIADDKAHAWVEYYDPSFGWRVFEATTASFEDTASSDFWNNLMNLFQTTDTHNADTGIINDTGINSDSLSDMLLNIIYILLFIILLIIALYLSYRYTKIYRSYHRNRRNINVRNFYKIIAYIITRKYEEFAYITTFKGQSDFIQSHYKLNARFNAAAFEKLNSILERSAFSNVEITSTEYQYAMKLLKLMRRNILFRF